MPHTNWFEDGLRFSCTQCGRCCSGPPGYVWFDPQEAGALAALLKLPVNEFLRRYARELRGKWTLKERRTPHGYDCVFLSRDAQGRAICDVYEARPRQCRTWPFWSANLAGPEDWRRAAQRCPGMDQGTFFSADRIRVIRDSCPGV